VVSRQALVGLEGFLAQKWRGPDSQSDGAGLKENQGF